MSKHSPAPWAFDPEIGRICRADMVTSKHGTIATVDSENPNHEADGRLIEAAPELLAMVIGLADEVDALWGRRVRPDPFATTKVRALIRRIEGDAFFRDLTINKDRG